jgi:trans-2-enoyl-CoA reductase
MSQHARALRFHATGNPSEVLQLDEIPLGDPGEGQVRVRMLAAPVNPADLNTIEGKYGVRPTMPAVPGNEGVGEVEAVGAGVQGLAPGDRVVLGSGIGTWCDRCLAAASDLARVPRELPVDQAAMVRVNPPTALLMLREFVGLSAGDWVIQNAANSVVGRCVIAVAKSRGLRTINVVRRPELVAELEASGADVVVSDDAGTLPDFRERTGGAKIRLAMNAVGGESALRLANQLAPGGVMVTYGAMGRQPLKIPNGLLIFKDLQFRGFWLTRWFRDADADARARLIGEIAGMMKSGEVQIPVAARYPLEDWKEAVAAASAGARAGKILFTMSA